ncbi:hypothetical protein LIER_29673 [Lithospermum erythrorhizon]|uniref:RNase H type-1 domain-containing protein n=1 Tax=Lithospermum erythrorhizon TaxID=34254 RepID=A0AAV3RNF4_LITER
MIREREIEPNPDKIKAILDRQPPRENIDIQKLTGCLAALSRFISKSGERSLSFFKNLRRASSTKFYWDDECKKAFEELKGYLSSPKLLSQPEQREVLQLYLVVSNGVTGSGVGILIRSRGDVIMEYALRFTFPTINNEDEYEAMIVGLDIVKSLGISRVWVKGDSKMIMNQVKGICGVRHEPLVKYYAKDVQLAQGFKQVIFEHIPRAQNE